MFHVEGEVDRLQLLERSFVTVFGPTDGKHEMKHSMRVSRRMTLLSMGISLFRVREDPFHSCMTLDAKTCKIPPDLTPDRAQGEPDPPGSIRNDRGFWGGFATRLFLSG